MRIRSKFHNWPTATMPSDTVQHLPSLLTPLGRMSRPDCRRPAERRPAARLARNGMLRAQTRTCTSLASNSGKSWCKRVGRRVARGEAKRARAVALHHSRRKIARQVSRCCSQRTEMVHGRSGRRNMAIVLQSGRTNFGECMDDASNARCCLAFTFAGRVSPQSKRSANL
jgi:hypothetical protein